MADQLYIEEGYIDASYYNIVAEAQVNMGSALTASISVIIADTSGYIFEGYIDDDFYEGAGQVREAYAALGVATTMAISVGKIVEADANFEAFGNTTLTADALKNHTAILDTTMSMSATVSKIASNVITLDSIINASLQGDRTRGVESTQTTSIDIQTAPSVFRDFGALLSSAGGFNLLMTVNADVAISVNSTMVANAISFTPKALPYNRPVNFNAYYNTSTTPYTGTDVAFNSTTKRWGTHSVQIKSPGFKVVSDPLYNNSNKIPASTPFVFETWVYFENDNFVTINTPFIVHGKLGNSYTNFSNLSGSALWAIGEVNDRWAAKLRKPDGTYVSLTTTTPVATIPSGSWTNVILTRQTNGTIRLIINNNMTSAASSTYTGALQADLSLLGAQEGRLILQNLDQLNYGDMYYDSTHYQIDTDAPTGITYPYYSPFTYYDMAGTSTGDSLVLANFDGNYTDDVSVVATTLTGAATLNTTVSLTATPNRTFGGTVLQQSAATLTVDANVIQGASADITSTATLNVITGFVKDATTTFDSIASQINVVNKIGNTLIACDVVSSLSADVNEIVQLASSLSTAVVVDADVNFIAGTSADFNSVSIMDADVAGGLIGFSVDLNSAFTSSIVYTRIIDLEVFEPGANFEYNFDVSAILDNTSDLNTAFTSTAAAYRIQQGSADLSAFATTLNSVAKIGTFLVDLDTVATLTADARVIADNGFALDVIADITASGGTTKPGAANLTSASTLSVEAVSGIAGEASLTGVTELQISPSSVISASAILDNAMGFSTTVRATRNNEIDLYNNASLVASASRTRNVANNLNTTTNLVASGGKLVGTSANLDSSTSLIGNGRIITLLQELEYTIQKETREFAILKETREYAILDETREYTV